MVKLSIVIPYYKTYDLTQELLSVLIPQLTDETEVYLIDDGCHENRFDKYVPKINVIHLKKNVGGASAINVGLDKVKGKYVSVIDSDDMVDKKYIKTLIKTINKQNEDVIFFDWQDVNNGVVVEHPDNYAIWKAIYKRNIMPRFREGYRYSYDVPFQIDLHRIDYSRYYIDKVLYYYNSNRDGNLTSIKEKLRRKDMIKVEVVKDFSLEEFSKIEASLERRNKHNKKEKGKLYERDIFVCDREMCEYLTGNNPYKVEVVKIIEVIPEIKKLNEESAKETIGIIEYDIPEETPLEAKVDLKEKKKTTKKKTTRKKSKK